MTHIEDRLHKVEMASIQRLPYKSFEELLNAMAALDKEKVGTKREMMED
jgi:hypothetical protein